MSNFKREYGLTNSENKCKTLDEAIILHDEAKREHIRNITTEYGDKLPKKVQKALLNW